MAWIAPTIAAVAALGSAAIGASRNNKQEIQQSGIANQGLSEAQQNLRNQQMIQALINQRSIAGQEDSQGNKLVYDPATNTWKSTLGEVPQQVQTAADQAAVSRNTTDLRLAQQANEQAAIRAGRAEPYADTARRQLENFRPMSGEQLTGLLQQQATTANNDAFRPLIQDTLRSFARTGTSAGPVMGQIGRDSSKSLREGLIDAQLKGITGADQINQSRRQDLQSGAQAGAGLATPAFGYSSISPSSYGTTMQSLLGQRATGASTAPAYGAGGVNTAAGLGQGAYKTAAAAVPDPNFDTNATVSGLNQLGTAFGKGGAGNMLLDALMKGSNPTGATDTTKKISEFGSGAATPDALAQLYGEKQNQGFYYP